MAARCFYYSQVREGFQGEDEESFEGFKWKDNGGRNGFEGENEGFEGVEGFEESGQRGL